MSNRYSRQIILPEIGVEGQKRLKEASVLIVGAGGLGSPITLYLAAAGIGHLTIADSDDIREHNLNRQILFSEADLGKNKVEVAKEKLSSLNSQIDIETFQKITAQNIYDVFEKRSYDVVVDATDNFETRYLLNDACVEKKIPFVFGGVLGWKGQVALFDSRGGACFQCLYSEKPSSEDSPTCFEAGVVGVLPGVIGSLQAAEVIKLILQKSNSLRNKMLLVDLMENSFRTVSIVKDPSCPVCG